MKAGGGVSDFIGRRRRSCRRVAQPMGRRVEVEETGGVLAVDVVVVEADRRRRFERMRRAGEFVWVQNVLHAAAEVAAGRRMLFQ